MFGIARQHPRQRKKLIMDVADRLVDEFGLLQSPSEATMKNFARLTRELMRSRGLTEDQAGTFAGREIFQAEYRRNPAAGAIEAILADTAKL
jgi:hypothetical protein